MKNLVIVVRNDDPLVKDFVNLDTLGFCSVATAWQIEQRWSELDGGRHWPGKRKL